MIRASAGSGKTFQLSNRYIAKLRHDAPECILATTFTRKAAGEIQARILLRLADAALNAKSLAELSDFVPGLTHDEVQRMLERVTQHLHRLRISTLDGFFSRLASSFTLELGLPTGWRIMDEVEDAWLRDLAIEQTMRQESPQDVVRLAHMLAKGRTVRGVHELIQESVRKFYIEYLQTERTAWTRIPEPPHVAGAELDAAIALLRSLVVADGNHRNARDKEVTLAESGNWEGLISKGIAQRLINGEPIFHRKPIPADLAAAYQPLLQHARAMILGSWAEQTRATYALLHRFHEQYELLKRDRRGLRFEDVTQRLAKRAAAGNVRAVAYRMDARIDHLLLDEFQDTSLSQWQVLRPFAEEVVRGHETSFFCVGDVKQAIYGWRGGVAAIFDAIEEQLPGLTKDALDVSYRSSPVIIETVNRVFQNLLNHGHLDGDLETIESVVAEYPPHRTAKANLPGYACLRTVGASGDDAAGPSRSQFGWVCRYIADLATANPQASIGVLLRKNASVTAVVGELLKLGVPASEEGGNPVADSAAVQLLLSLITLSDHPGDRVSRFHVANSPLGELLGFTDFADDAAAERLATRTRAALLDHGYAEAVYDWAKLLIPWCGPRDVRRLRQLVDVAGLFEPRAGLRPRQFVEFVRKHRVQDATPARVRVMTVHQSKGLEFDHVILPELDQQFTPRPDDCAAGGPDPAAPHDTVLIYRNEHCVALLPDELQRVFSQQRQRRIQEEMAVLYVALTRAVHGLHLLIAAAEHEKTQPRTLARLVSAALADGVAVTADTLLMETGDAQAVAAAIADRAAREAASQQTIVEPAAPACTQTERADAPIRFAEMPDGRQRGRPMLKPSEQHAAGDRVRLKNVLLSGDSAARDRGSLFHAWLECVRWLDIERPTEERLRRLAGGFGFQKPDLDRLLAQFKEVLRRPALVDLLTQAGYGNVDELPFPEATRVWLADADYDLHVETERPINVPLAGSVIHGVIDRLVLFRREGVVLAADVIDYKTDALSGEAETGERIETHRAQILAYARAIASIYRLPPERVAARLVFLSTGQVVTVANT